LTWLVDTNVISEIRKGARCHPGVLRWWRDTAPDDLFLSVLVIGEIRRGIARASVHDPVKAAVLTSWLAAMITTYSDRILPVSPAIAEIWGRISAPRPVPVIDALLAATAIVHDLTLVTRNVADTAGLGARILDPFAG